MGIPLNSARARPKLEQSQFEQVPGLPEHECPGAQLPFEVQPAKQAKFVPSHL
jgi:hypothetical protein